MPRGLSIAITFLAVALVGCSGSTSAPDESAPVTTTRPEPSAGGSDASAETQIISPPEVSSETDNRNATSLVDSELLTEALIELSAVEMKKRMPDMTSEQIGTRVKTAVSQARNAVPEFLMVTAEDNDRLRDGQRIESAAARIDDADAFLNNKGIQLQGPVKVLMPQHKAGTLSAVREELLAQLLVMAKRKLQVRPNNNG